ncbi:tetratricopeptide repeat protein [bacterium]|nr:tetratricopeptide repeat protein [bacterium]
MKRSLFVSLMILGIAMMMGGCTNPAVTSAKVYIQQNNYDKALEQALLATQQTPNDPEAWYVLGEVYGHKGMYKEMNAAFNKSLEISPKRQPEIDHFRSKYYADLFNNGVGLIKQDRLEEAVDLFDTAIELAPKRTEAYKNKGHTLHLLKQDSMAVVTYGKVLEIDPNDLETKRVIGILYYQSGKYQKCVDAMAELMTKADKSSQVYKDAMYHSALSYDLMNQPDKAIDMYNQAISEIPDKDLYFNLGRLYFQQKRFEDAIVNFKKVVEMDPADFDATMSVGNAYLNMEKYADALPFFEKSVELNPESANAWNNLGVTYVRTGQPQKGKEAFDKAEKIGTQP